MGTRFGVLYFKDRVNVLMLSFQMLSIVFHDTPFILFMYWNSQKIPGLKKTLRLHIYAMLPTSIPTDKDKLYTHESRTLRLALSLQGGHWGGNQKQTYAAVAAKTSILRALLQILIATQNRIPNPQTMPTLVF